MNQINRFSLEEKASEIVRKIGIDAVKEFLSRQGVMSFKKLSVAQLDQFIREYTAHD